MPLPPDYLHRLYAGVLGKVVGVYLGRPFEGALHADILREFGPIQYYVHEKCRLPLIVTDDDITGTFTFIRALEDHGLDIDAQKIGQTWLNYIIEHRTILWWGGLGMATEHTAFLRLRQGIPAPRSGAIETNGKMIAEQIGAQIFIDGWGMVAPGQPALAAKLARLAASVSHDGEAIYAAQVVAVLEAAAFVESDLHRMLDTALSLIPPDCTIARLIAQLRQWRREVPDWQNAFARLADQFGYHKFPGACHVVPNHGVIILALLWGDDDFSRSLMIANTCGWDTDCNSGNVGCIMGIKKGLPALDAGPDWRGPVADRILLPTADGGSAINDCATQALRLANLGRALAGLPPLAPKSGARFHFTLPGSVQGFTAEPGATISNTDARLRIDYRAAPARVSTPTFITPEQAQMSGYSLIACPTLYPGQTVRARVEPAPGAQGACRLYLTTYDAQDEPQFLPGPQMDFAHAHELSWKIPDTAGAPIGKIGLEISALAPPALNPEPFRREAQPSARISTTSHSNRTTTEISAAGTLFLDYLTWDGEPESALPVAGPGKMRQKAWVDAMDIVRWGASPAQPLSAIQNRGRGLLIQGTRQWRDYRLQATLCPQLAAQTGIALRVQGLRRYYALLLCPGPSARLLRMRDEETILAESKFAWEFGGQYRLALQAYADRIQAWIDDRPLFDLRDSVLACGAAALIVEEGHTQFSAVTVAHPCLI